MRDAHGEMHMGDLSNIGSSCLMTIAVASIGSCCTVLLALLLCIKRKSKGDQPAPRSTSIIRPSASKANHQHLGNYTSLQSADSSDCVSAGNQPPHRTGKASSEGESIDMAGSSQAPLEVHIHDCQGEKDVNDATSRKGQETASVTCEASSDRRRDGQPVEVAKKESLSFDDPVYAQPKRRGDVFTPSSPTLPAKNHPHNKSIESLNASRPPSTSPESGKTSPLSLVLGCKATDYEMVASGALSKYAPVDASSALYVGKSESEHAYAFLDKQSRQAGKHCRLSHSGSGSPGILAAGLPTKDGKVGLRDAPHFNSLQDVYAGTVDDSEAYAKLEGNYASVPDMDLSSYCSNRGKQPIIWSRRKLAHRSSTVSTTKSTSPLAHKDPPSLESALEVVYAMPHQSISSLPDLPFFSQDSVDSGCGQHTIQELHSGKSFNNSTESTDIGDLPNYAKPKLTGFPSGPYALPDFSTDPTPADSHKMMIATCALYSSPNIIEEAPGGSIEYMANKCTEVNGSVGMQVMQQDDSMVVICDAPPSSRGELKESLPPVLVTKSLQLQATLTLPLSDDSGDYSIPADCVQSTAPSMGDRSVSIEHALNDNHSLMLRRAGTAQSRGSLENLVLAYPDDTYATPIDALFQAGTHKDSIAAPSSPAGRRRRITCTSTVCLESSGSESEDDAEGLYSRPADWVEDDPCEVSCE
eukprot:scpid41518/ scgid29875/ 